MWWERVAKKKIRPLFLLDGSERRREEAKMENFYLDAYVT
jgi:hypothetical protein